MAWSAMPTFTDGAVLTAAQLNVLVNNLNETAAAKATAANQMFVSTGANAVAARLPTANTIDTAQTTTTTGSYGDLSTVGPQVTVTTGTRAMVWWGATISNSVAGGGGQMGYAITGASSISASDNNVTRFDSSSANDGMRAMSAKLQTGLTSGSNVFTAKYTTPSGGTGRFEHRHLMVIPL